MTRQEAREQAFVLVFQMAFNEDPVEEMVESAAACRDEEVDDYALAAAKAVQEHFFDIDAIISKYSTKWKLSRLSKVTASILRLAVGELCYMKDIPVGVVINEAVELAKKYGGDEDPAYVNGVLGGFVRDREPPAAAEEENG